MCERFWIMAMKYLLACSLGLNCFPENEVAVASLTVEHAVQNLC